MVVATHTHLHQDGLADPVHHVGDGDLPPCPRRPAHGVLLEAPAAAGDGPDIPEWSHSCLRLARLAAPAHVGPGAGRGRLRHLRDPARAGAGAHHSLEERCLMLGVLRGLAGTLSTMVRKPVTIQYPTVHRSVPERERGFPLPLWDHEVGEPFCTGCHACERACPTECTSVTMKDNPLAAEGTSKRGKTVERFLLDYGRCTRCRIW